MSGIASIILIIHIFIAIALIGVVLLQRSEGGALGIGGGAGSFLSAAGAGNALTRATMILAALFFGTSILLTVLSRDQTQKLKFGTHPSGPVSAPQPIGGPASLPPPGGAAPALPAGAPTTSPPAATAPATQVPAPVTPPKP